MIIAGIDEAGRGPLIGPMVLACIVMDNELIKYLDKVGVRDSKILSKNRRKRLFNIVTRLATSIYIVKIGVREIDLAVNRINIDGLNELEAKKVSEIILKLPESVREIYIDSPDKDSMKFKRRIRKYIGDRDVKIICEINADKKYRIVSAASIIAKVIRDDIIDEYKKKYGEIGSGYPSDNRTINFIKNWLKDHEDFPPIVRKSWKTLEKFLH